MNEQNIREFLLKLCAIPSVSQHADQENACADLILDELNKTEPQHGNTFFAEEFLCEHDPFKRKAVFALLKAAKPTKRTLLLTGHFDVVAVGGHKKGESHPAFHPDEYTVKIAEKELPSAVRNDLESGNWLFGRGTMDMKAGIALFIRCIQEFASDPDLNINLAFLAVPDEEADSAGMRGSMPRLMELLKENGCELTAAFTGEPCFWSGDSEDKDAYRPYFIGSTGKMMPFFYAVGVEAHLGIYFEGVNGSLLIANAVSEAEGDPEMMELADNYILTPPACLGMMVRRSEYSVTLPQRAAAYFNVLTAEKTPLQVLEWARRVCEKAGRKTLDKLRHAASLYVAKDGHEKLPKEIKVRTYAEIRELAIEKLGSGERFEEAVSQKLEEIPAETDAREKELRILEFLLDLLEWKEASFIIGFLSPYYPPRINTNKTEEEKKLRRLVSELSEEGGRMAGDNAVRLIEVFPGITDLSYLGFSGTPEELEALSGNLPGWGMAYWLPIDELLSLDVPVANMAGAGRDAHRDTERLEVDYSLRIAPHLLRKAIKAL